MTLAVGIPTLGELFDFRPVFLGINYTVYAMVVAVLLALGFLHFSTRRQAVVPGKLQLVGESLHGFVRTNIADEVIGHDGHRYVPFLMTLFVTIFFFNFMEVLPGVTFPPTSKIAVPMLFAAIVWVVFIFEGIRVNGAGAYFKGLLFPPGVPVFLYPLLTPIEFISNVIVRPITLTFRLTFNLLAGHLILSLISVLAVAVYGTGPKVVALPFVLLIGVVMTGFEIFVGFLQAFIFTILTALYIGGAIHPEH